MLTLEQIERCFQSLTLYRHDANTGLHILMRLIGLNLRVDRTDLISDLMLVLICTDGTLYCRY